MDPQDIVRKTNSNVRRFSPVLPTSFNFASSGRTESSYQQARQSPSPTHQSLQSQSVRPSYNHRRRDSDTLRSLVPPLSAGSQIGSPTVVERDGHRGSPPLGGSRLQPRYSPTGTSKGRTSPPTAKGRLSPPGATGTKGRTSPPTAKGRLSPNTAASKVGGASINGRDLAKHRRSPTAPEPPTTSGLMRDASGVREPQPVGKVWAGVDREDGYISTGERERERAREKERDREREREKERERERKWQQLQQSQQQHQLQQQQSYAQSAPVVPQVPAQAAQLNRHIVVCIFFNAFLRPQ